jgi:hypothetical protein
MSKPSLPSPHEPFVDMQTGKVSDPWYRYLSQELTQSNALTDVVGGLSTGTTGLTAVAFSSFATAADQEAAVSGTAVVTSSVQQFHPSAAKAWGVVSLAGTVATVDAGYGVNTAASTATGYLKVNLTVPFSSTNYVVVPSVKVVDSGVSNRTATIASSLGLATTTFTLISQLGDGTNADSDSYYFVCYGDQ